MERHDFKKRSRRVLVTVGWNPIRRSIPIFTIICFKYSKASRYTCIVSSFEFCPPLNSFRSNKSIYEVKLWFFVHNFSFKKTVVVANIFHICTTLSWKLNQLALFMSPLNQIYCIWYLSKTLVHKKTDVPKSRLHCIRFWAKKLLFFLCSSKKYFTPLWYIVVVCMLCT